MPRWESGCVGRSMNFHHNMKEGFCPSEFQLTIKNPIGDFFFQVLYAFDSFHMIKKKHTCDEVCLDFAAQEKALFFWYWVLHKAQQSLKTFRVFLKYFCIKQTKMFCWKSCFHTLTPEPWTTKMLFTTYINIYNLSTATFPVHPPSIFAAHLHEGKVLGACKRLCPMAFQFMVLEKEYWHWISFL